MKVPANAATDSALVQLACEVLPVWIRHLASSRGQSEAAVGQMLAAFGELAPLLSAPSSTATDAVDRMYQGFQYEDRVGQMMALLQQDMERLLAALTCADASLDATQWLQRLQSGYVMAEQHQVHGQTASGQDETTFF